MWILFALMCMGVGFFAYKKFNRNFWIWTILAFLLSPLFSLIILFVVEYIIFTSPKTFSRKMLDIDKLYKNGLIDENEYKNSKEKLLLSIKTNNLNDFLVKILPLIENNVLNQEDIEKLKRRFNG